MNYDEKTESLEIFPQQNTTIIKNNDNPIQRLPVWALNDSHPAFFDSESATAIEQTARVYGKIQEMIAVMNEFTATIEKAENEHKKELEEKLNSFVECMKENLQNHIECIDIKMNNQDMKIKEAKQYMVDNIVQTATNIINEGLANGSIVVGLNYNETTEELSITGTVADGTESSSILYDSSTETIYHSN